MPHRWKSHAMAHILALDWLQSETMLCFEKNKSIQIYNHIEISYFNQQILGLKPVYFSFKSSLARSRA